MTGGWLDGQPPFYLNNRPLETFKKMWKILDKTDLLCRLTAQEKNALNTASTDISQSSALDDVCALVAQEWRSRIAKYHTVDTRPLAIPDELLIHILADYRYRAFTRLPNMSFLLDQLRVDEWREARDVLDNLDDFSLTPPETENTPETSATDEPVIDVAWSPVE